MSVANNGISRFEEELVLSASASFSISGTLLNQDSSFDVAGNVILPEVSPFFQIINVNQTIVVTLPDLLADGITPGVPNGVRMRFFVNGAVTLGFKTVLRAGGPVIEVVRNTAAAGVTYVQVANSATTQLFPIHSYVELMSSNLKWIIVAMIPV
jgi:hypothetical protein